MNRERSSIRKLYAQLIKAELRKFPRSDERLEVTPKHGVYVIFSPGRKVLHVGRTLRGQKGLSQRLKNHLHGASSFTISHFDGKGSRLRGTHSFSYIEVSNPRTRALLEAYAVGHLCPKHLGVGKNAS